MKISASNLVKRSASQLLFMEMRKLNFKATDRQKKGNEYSEEIVSLNKASAEKRGIIPLKKDLLFFCIDMVKENKLVEIKMVDDMKNYPDWYLKSSIIQSSFYAKLASKVKTLDTPKFMKNQGYIQEVIDVPQDFDFELWFGDDKYLVSQNDELFDHYLKKIKTIKKGLKHKTFDEVRDFDRMYKFKEFEIFKPEYVKLS